MITRSRKKSKTINVVFYDGDSDYLLFRLEEFGRQYDYFIIVESKLNDENILKFPTFDKNNSMFQKWSDKIIHLISDISEYDHTNDSIKQQQAKDILKTCKNLDLDFDDVIIFCEQDEFPVIHDMERIKELLAYEPIMFSLLNFLWSKEFVKNERYVSCFCCQYSYLITKEKDFIICFNNIKKYEMGLDQIPFGYKLEMFYTESVAQERMIKKYSNIEINSLSDKIKFSRNELVYFDFDGDFTPKQLKRYIGELPKNIDILESQKIGRTVPKKHCITFTLDSLHNLEGEYDSVSIILPTDKVLSKGSIVSNEKTNVNYIVIPKKQYYDILIDENNLQNFQKMFFFNESKKVLKLKNPLEIDEFHFYLNGEFKVFCWKEIRDNFIYDLLHN